MAWVEQLNRIQLTRANWFIQCTECIFFQDTNTDEIAKWFTKRKILKKKNQLYFTHHPSPSWEGDGFVPGVGRQEYDGEKGTGVLLWKQYIPPTNPALYKSGLGIAGKSEWLVLWEVKEYFQDSKWVLKRIQTKIWEG